MTKDIRIAPYNPKNLPQIKIFIEKLQDHVISLDTFDRVHRSLEFGKFVTEKVLKNVSEHGGIIYLAFDGSQLVGMVIAVILSSNYDRDLQVKPGKYGEIEKLYILPEYRHKGVGKQLMEKAEEYLTREAHCDFIEIVVFGDNKQALEIYKKRGYREREYVLLKKVHS